MEEDKAILQQAYLLAEKYFEGKNYKLALCYINRAIKTSTKCSVGFSAALSSEFPTELPSSLSLELLSEISDNLLSKYLSQLACLH